MISQFDMVIYDMFGGSNNRLLESLQPYRNIRVVDQLLINRHMWSQTLSELSTDERSLEEFLMQINNDISRTYVQYSEKPQEKLPSYFLREFKISEFSNFIDSGRQYYRDKIEAINNYIKEQQEQKEQTTNDPDLYSDILEQKINSKFFNRLIWKKPAFTEIEKYLQEYMTVNRIDSKNLHKTYQKTNPTIINKNQLVYIENSQSWRIDNIQSLINRLGIQKIRDYIQKFTRSMTADMPVLIKNNEKFHLITDDEPLMMYSVLDIPIQVIILEL